MSVYTAVCQLKNRDVNLFRRLRSSRFLELMQEASIAHTEQLHMGRSVTLDKGLLWVVVQQRFEISRMPEYDEEVRIETWPGKTLHVLFPRYYRFLAADGQVLAKGSAMWMLAEQESRKMVFPAAHGIEVEETITGNECGLPETLHMPHRGRERIFTVPFSSCDLNGHMNNTKYLDLCEDLADMELLRHPLRMIETEYLSEVRCGDTVKVFPEKENNVLSVFGEKKNVCFRIRMKYENVC